MVKYKALAVATKYWKPGENCLEEIIKGVKKIVSSGDFVVVSEKAISTATNNVVDENKVKPSLNAELIAKYWMRVAWGYFLGPLCHYRERLLKYLREYPVEMGSRHKQVVLQQAGLLQALMFGSEGGVDGSNLAFAYVSLPLRNANEIAQEIREKIRLRLERQVFVMIMDTDKTYAFRNLYFTPRPKPMKGIRSLGGFITYLVGRVLRLEKHPTPIAVAGCKISIDEALRIASLANRVRGFGAGKTVWDMVERFKVGLTEVSWEMLETVKHKPIVIVRKSKG